jgi:ubiquinone/menaquinone biosynthesis C-methylase UbiE
MRERERREYMFGTHDAEIVRLGLQHKLWSASAFAIWERAGIRAGQTVLDIGSGPGWTSFDLAGIVTPRGKVIAVDESERFLAHLEQRRKMVGDTTIETRVEDVQHLGLDAESVDAAYQRWVLCFVRDPEAVIRGVARALKRGGVFAIQEYMHYEGVLLTPESKPFQRFIQTVARTWRELGGDTEMGLRLPSMLVRAGLKVVEFTPVHRVAQPSSQLWTWPTIFIENYGRKLLDEGRLSREDHAALVADWAERTSDPNAIFVSPPMVDIVAVKP